MCDNVHECVFYSSSILKEWANTAVQFKQSNIRFVSLWQFVCQCLCKFNANNRKWFCSLAPHLILFHSFLPSLLANSTSEYPSFSSPTLQKDVFCQWVFEFSSPPSVKRRVQLKKLMPVFVNVCPFCRFTFSLSTICLAEKMKQNFSIRLHVSAW